MRKITGAILFLLVMINLSYFLFRTNSPYLPIGVLLLLFVLIYFIISLVRYLVSRSNLKKTQATATPVEFKKKSNGIGIVPALVAIIVMVVFNQTLGRYGFQVFVFVDALTAITRFPVLNWALLGLFIGFVYATFVAWKKYKLSFAVNFISLGLLLLFALILFRINHPAGSQMVKMQQRYAYNLVRVTDKNSDAVHNTNSTIPYLTDSSDYTVWIKEIKRTGADDEIEFTFSYINSLAGKNLQCVGFMLRNGNRKSMTLWNDYSRLKTFSVWKNETFVTRGEAADDATGFEDIKMAPVSLKIYDRISIKFSTVFPGRKYPKKIAITELIPIVQYEELY